MQAKIFWPHGNYTGNLLWAKGKLVGLEDKLALSLSELRGMGYWASPYPEGDGVTFKPEHEQSELQMMSDFINAFPWLVIKQGDSRNYSIEAAELEELGDASREIECIVMVPLERVHFEETFELGIFRFVCAKEFQSPDEERFAKCNGPYVQFSTKLRYADLLRSRGSISANDLVINKCLSIAEHAMDVIRFEFSSFAKPEFTPNPAGQLNDGFYGVEIIPVEKTHLKALKLEGIARPMSALNNWLGPEILSIDFDSRAYLAELLNGRSDDLALAVKSALRGCRQSFYSLGDESKFLNLVFTLDGLAHPKRNWTGWTQRTYIAALVSHGQINTFVEVLKRYDELYDIRNALVHKGRDFHEMGQAPQTCCQDLYDYVRDVVNLISDQNITTVDELHNMAKAWLSEPTWQACYQSVINEICSSKGIPVQNMPAW